jgi:acetyl-CoA acetyltransferase
MTSGSKRGPRAAITGIGSTAFGVFPGEDANSLGSTAFRAAMREAGLKSADIDGLIVCRIPDYQRFGELHGMDPQFAVNLPGQGRMASVALQMACQAIASGALDTVALVYGNDGRTAGMKYGDRDRGSRRHGSGTGTARTCRRQHDKTVRPAPTRQAGEAFTRMIISAPQLTYERRIYAGFQRAFLEQLWSVISR